MDKKPGSSEPAGPVGIEPQRTRQRLERDLKGLRYELDFPRKIRSSFRDQTVLWVGAAVAVGAILILLPRGRKKIYVDVKGRPTTPPKSKLIESGLLLGALKIAASLARPAIMNFVREKMTGGSSSYRQRPKW